MKSHFVAAMATALLVLGASHPAHADTTSVHPDVQYALSVVPGGTLVDPLTAVWPATGMTLSASASAPRAVGTCATGQFCAYSGANRSGTKLSWSACGTVSTSALATVGSVANARSSGKVHALNSANAVLTTVAAGGSVNVVGATRSLRCVA